MKKAVFIRKMLPVYVVVLALFLAIGVAGSRMVTVFGSSPLENRRCVIIDAGHGGEDGGASTREGVLESNINLQIALRLNDLMQLLGIQTKMIRTQDISVYTQGETIAAKKVSDLKNRVKTVNETQNALLVSIHQNHYAQSQYSGAQVFYAQTQGSKDLAQQLQSALVSAVNPGSKRMCKKSEGVYLMRNIQCTGILVECGFLSNPEESAKLQDPAYQQKLCSVIASVCSRYLGTGTDLA